MNIFEVFPGGRSRTVRAAAKKSAGTKKVAGAKPGRAPGSAAASAASPADSAAALEYRVARLALLSRAVWELTKEKTKLTDADLLARFEKLDLLDGKRDGRLATPPRRCGSCGRRSTARFGYCMLCGAAFGADGDDPFDLTQ